MSSIRRNFVWLGIGVLAMSHGLYAEEIIDKDREKAAPKFILRLNDQDSDLPADATALDQLRQEPLEVILLKDRDEHVSQKLPESQGKYWIGLMCIPPGDVLRAQLDLDPEVGLVVEEVQEGTPAKKAGLLPYDLLLSATIVGKQTEGRKLKSIADLSSSVQEAGHGVLKLEFLRRGRKQVLDVVPTERLPAAERVTVNVNAVIPEAGQAPVRFRWAGPMLLNMAPPLPDGTSLEFLPAEGQPEKVIVKRENQTWDADIKSLDKLPPDLALVVQQQLASRHAMAARSALAYREGGKVGQTLTAHIVSTTIPDDVTVSVSRKGNEQVMISVKKGDQTWEGRAHELSKFPAEVRPYAELASSGQLGVGKLPHINIYSAPTSPNVAPPRISTTVRNLPRTPSVNSEQNQNEREIERKLKELTEQVERLRTAVERSQTKE